jgi:bifunctional non-homologous end joining protein LigD
MVKDTITLYFKEGSSDKVYTCSVEEAGGGCTVPFAYGRRGQTMQTGCKTASPVPYDKAKKIFDQLVREKTAKGYTPGASGTPYSTPAVAVGAPKVSTGINPQLLNVIETHELEVRLSDDVFVAQEKFDGRRLMLHRVGDKIVAINRKGLEVAFPETLRKDAENIKGDFLIDGEVIGDTLHAFDMLSFGGNDIDEEGYLARWKALKSACAKCGGFITVVDTAIGNADKRKLLAELKARGAEGIVLKDRNSKYHPGRPASGGSQLKYKFTKTCSCVVTKVNGAKRSVALELDDDGTAVPVGNCTIPVGKAIPGAGDIVEIRYLYAYRGGSLYQPVFLGVRDDIGIEGCALKQLQYKQEGADEDEA